MRSEQEMYGLILKRAQDDHRIRAVILNGSRTNPAVKPDPFQDYDIVYLVQDVKPFKTEDIPAWFGKILVMERTDESELYNENHEDYVCYLMQFLNGNRIDLTVANQADFAAYCFNDRLAKVLLDKDNMLPQLASPDERSHFLSKPSARLFQECMTEFWWTAPYVAKGLWRGQILYAQSHMEHCTRNMLVQMLSWYAGAEHGFDRSVGKQGDRLAQVLPADWWQRLIQTFARGKEDEIWNALLTAAELFAAVSKKTAVLLAFSCNEETARKVTQYLRYCRALPKDAKTLNPLETGIYEG